MRPKVLIPTMIVLLAALTALLWRQPTPKAVRLDTVQQPVQSSSNMLVAVTNAAENAAPTGVLSNSEPPTSQSTSENPKPTTEMIHKYLESLNVPIEFYGKVIDQDGNPLADVSVKGEVLHIKVIAPAPGGAEDQIIPIDQRSDSDGRFEIQGMTGRGLTIESIQKDSYEVEPTSRSHGTTEGSFNSPVIFKMWSTNVHEPLITGGNKFQIVPDGRPYFINLTDDTISESGEGDLKIWIQYTNQPVRGQFSDWSAEIDVAKGGLLETKDYSMFSAPTEGYVPSFVWKNQIKGGQRGNIGERRFYLKLKDGQEYGRMTIELIAPFNDQTPGLIRLSYAINPSGSRILR
jgi:hypothetical protein